jgi:glycosyltransferase involved in cell wall biosynthesis
MNESAVVVATDGAGSLAGYARSLSARLAAPVVTVPGGSGSFSPRVIRRLRAFDAPLLHLTSHHLARYGPFLRTPYVVTVHDLMRYRDWRERGAHPPLIEGPTLRDGLQLELDAAGLRGAAVLIAVSEHTRRELVDLLGVPDERVAVVPEGVDTAAFRHAPRPGVHEPYILYVGSEQPRKNLGTLFSAFRRVKALWPAVRLVKVGDPGSPGAPFRQVTLDEARATGVLPHLEFAGRVSHEELVGWYSSALCLVQPSRHEGFGLPVLEAMACGCPVVTSAGGSLPEVVGGAGVVYGDPDNVDSLASTLSRLMSSTAERCELARAGRERATAMSWERTAALTRRVWHQALGAAPQPDARPGAAPRFERRPASEHAVGAG